MSGRGTIASVRRRAADPLYRNGYALIASSALTSALGLVYWGVAARVYPPAAVGVSAALISAMTLLANLCQLNLKSALNRFLPRAGRGTARFVTRSYTVALAVSGVVSIAFVAGVDVWSGSLAFLGDRPLLALWFVLATMAWTVFVLEDSVLTGIRRAGWVPVENLAYSVLKVVALVAVAGIAPTLGAFVAWSAPLVLLIVPVNLLLYRRLMPAHVRETAGRPPEEISPRAIARYVAADYLAYLMMAATIGVLPLAVLAVLGPAANAYYFVAWSVAYGLYLIASSLGMAMITEAALDPGALATHQRTAVAETVLIMVPAVVLVVAGAPEILALLGGGYASEATGLLRLLALSALPWVVFVDFTNVARVQRRMGAVIAATAALCAVVLGVGLPLLRTLGIDALGVAWLAGQTVTAAGILLAGLLRATGTVADRRARVLRAAGAGRAWAVARRRRVTSARPLKAALASVRAQDGRSTWRIHRHLTTLNDVAVATVGPAGAEHAAYVKRACSRAAAPGLARHVDTLRTLRRLPGLARLTALTPEVLASGSAGGRPFVVESAVPGVASEPLLHAGAPVESFFAAGCSAIAPLHAATESVVLVDDALLRGWVDDPLRILRAAARRSGVPRAVERLDRLGDELRGALAGRRMGAGRIHGDLCPGNLLLTGDGKVVEGIVDWEQSRELAPPELDIYHLFITTRAAVERRELGDVVAGVLRDRSLARPVRTFTVLAWLHHMAGNLEKSERYGRSRVWLRGNLDPVLAVVAEGPAVPARRPADIPWVRAASPVAALGTAVGLWAVSVGQIKPRAMGDLGLVPLLPAGFLLALAVLTASFVTVAHRRPERHGILVAHLLALVAFLHATPSILYGTLRYSWAWKHVGIVDYIQRHHTVTPDIHTLPVYHDWPGFFGVGAALTELAGLPDALTIAVWGPVFFGLLNLGAVLFVFSALTRDRRVVWLATWLFFLGDWVGQDYFAPQAFAFFLYLVAVGIALRWLGPAGGEETDRLRRPAGVLVVLAVAAIVVSHALTAVMVCLALAVLVAARVCTARLLPFVAAAMTLVWDLTFAAPFTGANAGSTFGQVRLPWATTESSLAAVGQLTPHQALVAHVARALVVAMAGLAAYGLLRERRARRGHRAAVVLAGAPALLFASGNYDGEILFRIFLFALPFLAFLAAHVFVGAGRLRGPRLAPAVTFVVTAALLGAFLVAYYGKEHQNYFTPSEVAAARYVATHVRPGALVVDGTHNYPAQFKNYERYEDVSIAREPPASRGRLLADPARVLEQWMLPRASAYVILTRSQETEVDENGTMPRGSVLRIARALGASGRFRTVLRNRDAVVFTLAGPRPAGVGG